MFELLVGIRASVMERMKLAPDKRHFLYANGATIKDVSRMAYYATKSGFLLEGEAAFAVNGKCLYLFECRVQQQDELLDNMMLIYPCDVPFNDEEARQWNNQKQSDESDEEMPPWLKTML